MPFKVLNKDYFIGKSQTVLAITEPRISKWVIWDYLKLIIWIYIYLQLNASSGATNYDITTTLIGNTFYANMFNQAVKVMIAMSTSTVLPNGIASTKYADVTISGQANLAKSDSRASANS